MMIDYGYKLLEVEERCVHTLTEPKGILGKHHQARS